jgi:hypothetical protein
MRNRTLPLIVVAAFILGAAGGGSLAPLARPEGAKERGESWGLLARSDRLVGGQVLYRKGVNSYVALHCAEIGRG